jgi:oligoendopeptidase F
VALSPADADAEPAGLPTISLEQTWSVAVEGLRALAPQLADDAEELRRAGRVDLEDRPGKQPYAVTLRTGLDPPAFLALRYSGRAANATTLGHELGHAVALGTMRRAQPPVARGWPGVAFEVPSLLGEIASGDALVAGASEAQRPGLRLVAAQDFAWSVFEGVAFCRVELDLYAARASGRALTTERILAAFTEHFGALFRGVCAFGERDALVAMAGWANYAAGYRFYNFQYAVGALTALALMSRRQGEEEAFASSLLRFLSYGASASPAEQLSVFGIELGSRALWEEGLAELEARFAGVAST